MSAHMRRVIERLLKEAGAPAIECAVTLVGGTVTIHGSLSLDRQDAEVGLRMLSPDPTASASNVDRARRLAGEVPMMEHFFHFDDVMVVTVRRTVTTESPRIVTA